LREPSTRAFNMFRAKGRLDGRNALSANGFRISTQCSPLLGSDEGRKAETCGPISAQGSYLVRLASSEADRMAAFRLRFLVFNLELDEGLDTARATGYDIDQFDAVCDHLIVDHAGSGQVVGTYRLQSGAMASANLGYYSEREFDFARFRQLGDS
jgi:putative hemolysin